MFPIARKDTDNAISLKCPNLAAEKPESCQPCGRCVRKGRPCKYGGNSETPKARQPR